MEIKIKKKVVVEEIVDIELPFYYRHGMDFDHNDVTIYGRVDKDKHVSITINTSFRNKDVEFELEIDYGFCSGTISSYMEDDESCEEAFLKAKSEMLIALDGV